MSDILNATVYLNYISNCIRTLNNSDVKIFFLQIKCFLKKIRKREVNC